MANADMIGSTIQNYKRLQERRIVFEFRLTYECSTEQIRQITQRVEAIIRNEDKARFDRCHFRSFGESALEFETVYIVLDASYNVYMDVQQRINLAIMEAVAALDTQFAFPSRMVHVASLPESAALRPVTQRSSRAGHA
jgi:small-conductance mechanosensitive channel